MKNVKREEHDYKAKVSGFLLPHLTVLVSVSNKFKHLASIVSSVCRAE